MGRVMQSDDQAISSSPKRHLYIFLDEAGNFDFSSTGTKYFLIGSITKERPFEACKQLTDLKYDLVESGLDIEYFHASEDRQNTRNKVFSIIKNNLPGVRYDALIVEKSKTNKELHALEKFYPTMLANLLRHVLSQHDLNVFSEVIVFTDRIPVNKKRSSVEKAVKQTLKSVLPAQVEYRVFHHDSKSNFDLQISDYFNWAVYRKWERSDSRSFGVIQDSVLSEIEFQYEG
jgi:hypothetical protein